MYAKSAESPTRKPKLGKSPKGAAVPAEDAEESAAEAEAGDEEEEDPDDSDN